MYDALDVHIWHLCYRFMFNGEAGNIRKLMESHAGTPRNSLLQILKMKLLVHVASKGVSSKCSQFFVTKWMSYTEYRSVPPLLNGDIHACVSFLVGFLGLPLLLFCCRVSKFFSLLFGPSFAVLPMIPLSLLISSLSTTWKWFFWIMRVVP